MPLNEDLFGAKNPQELEEVAIEDLIFDVQMLLQAKMAESGITQEVLARRLKVSAARVSQLFSTDGGNITLTTLARMAHALSLTVDVDLSSDERPQKLAAKSHVSAGSRRLKSVWSVGSMVWTMSCANDPRSSLKSLAA
jgi:plasmid maintenance system antidote protein VapI